MVRVDSRLKQTWRGGGRHWKEGEGNERSRTKYMCVNEKGTVAQCGCKEQSWSRWTSSSIWGQLCKVMETVGVTRKRVQAGWSGRRRVAGVICDRRVPAEMKGKLYKTVLRKTSYGVWLGESCADRKTGDGA